MVSKGQLEIELSRIKGFEKPKVRLEQYEMDSKIGAETLWSAYMLGDIGGRIIGDLGCGTGILGIGALLLGAKEVIFVDVDSEALEIAKFNVSKLKSEDKVLGKTNFLLMDVKEFSQKVDVVIQNPPFGVKKKGNDRIFLEKAFENAKITYHFGKIEGDGFINKFSEDHSVKVRNRWVFDYPIKGKYGFHTKKIHRFRAGCWRLEKVPKSF
ncbi:MAG: methyltransferase [Nanoarchaeota archaeon]|nr:methyltransferase [Nanoarchaeota archaeon]